MLYLAAPDKPSGEAFARVLADFGVDYIIRFWEVPPRVVGEELSHDPQVGAKLGEVITEAKQQGFDSFAIACNTWQLWLDKRERGIRVYTTMEAVEKLYSSVKDNVWLGTTPFVNAMSKRGSTTLLSLGQVELQKTVQEIIWRIKAVTGASFTTALAMESPDNEQVLRQKMLELARELEALGIKRVILGCTELPIGWEMLEDNASIEAVTRQCVWQN